MVEIVNRDLFIVGIIVIIIGIICIFNRDPLWEKIVSLIISVFGVLCSLGAIKINPPNQELKADTAFSQGHYNSALALYKDILVSKYDSIPISISMKLENTENCLKWKGIADEHYNKREFKEALIEYQKIIAINPKDTYVEKQISECNKCIIAEEKKAVEQKRIEEQKTRIVVELYRNGKKPINLLVLNCYNNLKFYIYSDDAIMCYNISTNEVYPCSHKERRIYKHWKINGNEHVGAWSFCLSFGNNSKIEEYTVSTYGEVWAMATNGKFSKFGYITNVDF